VRSNLSKINVYKKPSIKSAIVTQLLYGETFKRIKQVSGWLKIKNDIDNYVGYIKKRKFPKNEKNTHKVFTVSSNLYSRPKNKYKLSKKLSFGSKIKVSKKRGNFYKFDNFWIKKKFLKKIDFKKKNIFYNVEQFVNIKYRWGGKHYTGVDCSGLIQLFLNFNNKYCPRDTKDQIKYFKKKVNLNNIKKNDLVFWKGHVALILSKNKLVHAYGPLKKVIIMPVKKTIDQIYRTANLKVLEIKRIS
tara:strand:+ start:741 stop:1475 length:735 start_codon:yes stop_codon:yes gene_type:complete